MTKASKAAHKAWETRRKNANAVKKTTKTTKLMPATTPRVIVYDIPAGAKRVKVLPGYQKVEFTK